MKYETFLAKYANTPISERTKRLDDIYFRVKWLEETIRPLRIKRDRLLNEVDKLNILK